MKPKMTPEALAAQVTTYNSHKFKLELALPVTPSTLHSGDRTVLFAQLSSVGLRRAVEEELAAMLERPILSEGFIESKVTIQILLAKWLELRPGLAAMEYQWRQLGASAGTLAGYTDAIVALTRTLESTKTF